MDLVEEIEQDVEELFPPKPGGLVDRHRKKVAAEKAAQKEREHEAEKIEERAYQAVKTAQESPEIFSALTYTIAAGQYAMILPNSPYRYRATVNLVTAAASVVLAKDSGAALGGTGYIMSSGNPPMPVYARAQLWAYNNSDATIQVSVLAEIYAPEQVERAKVKAK
jgi:hypothetical protein